MPTLWGFLSTLERKYFSCSTALLGNTVKRWNMTQSSNDSRKVLLGLSLTCLWDPCTDQPPSAPGLSCSTRTWSPKTTSLHRTETSWSQRLLSCSWRSLLQTWPSPRGPCTLCKDLGLVRQMKPRRPWSSEKPSLSQSSSFQKPSWKFSWKLSWQLSWRLSCLC